ncbi:MAG: InlB B-repeat-containing protein, partial [Ruminiclostridium sp.]|nr:InlB B-repeat-containing protein [Ruminiclostridium sp.]
MKKRILAMFMAMAMAFSLLPTSVLAAPGDNRPGSSEEAESLPIHYFIAEPGQAANPNGDYLNYKEELWGAKGGTYATPAADSNTQIASQNGIRNVNYEEEVTQFIQTWPEGYTEETFKKFGSLRINGVTYTEENYDLVWVTICKRGSSNLRCYCGVNYEHIHIDGVLTKKIEPAELKLTKTIPAAQSQDETFTFTLRELAQTENYVPVEPMTYVKDSEVTMTATIPAGQKSAAIQSSVEGTEIGFGYYELVESSSDKWQSAPVYILIATDGSLKYSSTYNGRYTQSNVGITVSNQYKTYTVTYTDGLENVNAFNDQKYTGLVYGTNTPSFQGGTPVYPGGTMVFDGWDSEVAETVTGNVTYTAQWKDNAYTVTWLNEDGKTVLEKDIDVTNGTRPEYNGDTPKKAADNQYTYTFAGWSPAITPVNGADQVYIAVYTPVLNTYTVKWYDADHTLLEIDENVPYNTFPTYDNANDKGTTAQLAAAKNTAQYTYRFAGWSPVPAAVTGDQEYVATYTQTTNQYTVTWLNYNDSQLGQDHKDYGAVPAYLIEGDAARGQYPTRPDTANYTYVFNGWWCDKDGDRMEDEGEVYGKDAPLPAVTGDVTYKARFTPVMKTFDVTLKLFLDENPVDDSVIHDQEEVPVLKTDASSEEFSCVEPEGTTGTYLFKNVPNGTYRIYHQGGTKPVCSQIIVVENGDVTKECHYYSVIYDGNGADSGSVPADAHHHLGTSVTVGNAPTREGYTFDGWWYDADNDNTVDKGEIYQPNASLTNSITKPYRLAAQWVEKVDVKINVTIDHTYGDNWDDSSSKDNVIVELISKPKSGTDSWLEVDDGELNLSADGYGEEKFAYQITPDDADEKNVTKTEYQAKKATFANMRGDLDYNVTVTKAGYEVKSISATQDSVTHDWTIDVVLKYAPDDAELNFSVAMDEGVPEEAYPDAVIAKVIYWDSTSNSWEFIQEHAGNNPGIRVNIDDVTGEGSGSHTVWTVDHNKNDEPYGYRFIIDSFVYDGKIVPATPDSAAESYTDNLFTGMMQDIETNEKYGGFKYAYFENENDTQLGTLRAVITMELFDVIFHGNGGTTEGEAMLTLADQYQVPDLTKYTPVHEKQGHVFEGWFEDEALTDPAESNERLTADKHLYAKWKHPLTVLGDIHVDATYTLDGETKTINEADRITSVTVLLQHAAEGSDHFINVDSRSVSITYSGENPSGTGDYEFINLENTGTWRIQVLGRNYNVLYKNENVTEYGTSSFNAVDNNNDDVARVDVKMNFEPATFDLSYLVDASAIGEGFKPANAEVMVLYDDKPSESDSPRDWPVISQMQDGFRGFTGQTSEVDKVDTYSVWKYHPQGYLYDYAIRVEAVDTVDLTGNEPYTVEYNGSAEYKEADTSATTERYEQTQLLIAKLVPKTYPIKYYMEKPGGINSTIELMGMTVTSHTWSHATYLKDADGNWKDVPTRAGYVFTGWVNERGESVTEIAANVQAETKLYATWTLDSWADAEANENDNITEDALTGGDGIPDSEQVHVRYEAEANGTTTPVGEIYTIPGEDFTDVEVTVTSGSTAAPASGYAVDLWSYVANESDANDTATLNRNGASIKPVINNADGGKTYTFKVSFAKDDWKDDPNGPDSPTGGDGTPDKYQAMVEFHTVNYQQGTVSGNIYQVTTFANGASSGTVTPTLDGVIVDPEDGWAFDYWTLGSDSSDKLTEANVTTSRTVDAGSTTIFYAHFAKDDWKDADETTDPNDKDTPAGGDGIPDYKQALVKFSAAANGRGTVTGDGAVQIFTLPANNAGQYVGNITPVNTAEVSVIVTPNTGYAFDYWGDPDNFWDEGYG